MSDTTTAGEGDPSAVAARPTTGRRILVWAVLVGLVAAGTVSLAAADLAAQPMLGGAAARFVPADGVSQVIRDTAGDVTVRESARGTGPAMLLQLPALAGGTAFSSYPDDTSIRAQWWRETVTATDGSTPQLATLYALDDRGVSMVAAVGGENGFVFTPALTVLPADAAPGARWTGEGAALPQDLLRYRTTGEVSAAADGCLRVATTLQYLDPGTGGVLLDVVDESTWCPGRGVVASTTTAGDTVIENTVEAFGDGPRPDGLPAPASGSVRRDWSDASGWSARDATFLIDDPAFGDSEVGTPSDGTHAVTASGVLALGAGGDVIGYARDGSTVRRAWIGAPGGSVVRVTAAGSVVLAATTERRLVAYDDRGVRLWSRSYPDIVLAPPVVGRDGEVVVVALDGTVESLDLASGEARWTSRLRTDVEAAPALTARLAVVVDRAGVVHALDLGDGAERWSAEPLSAALVAAAGERVAVVGETGEITTLTEVDGSVLRSEHVRGVTRAALAVDGVLVVQTDEATTGWRLDSGRRVWSDVPGSAIESDGRGHVVLLGGGEVVVRAATGGEPTRIDVGDDSIAVTRMLVPFADAVWVVGTSTTGIEVAR